MKKLVIANWKMNKDFSDIKPYVKYMKKNLKDRDGVVVCVPSILLKQFADLSRNVVKTGAQNCYFEEKGEYTGEISPSMVKSAGASYILVGHSERRRHIGETNEMLNKKVKACLKHDFKVVFCIGEKLEDKSKYKSVLKKQIIEGLDGITDFSNIVIAYEPVWAIGSGIIPTSDDISRIHGYIKRIVKEIYNAEIAVLYGGSVKPKNCNGILPLPEVDGVLVGGACLKVEEFVAIANSR